MDTVETHLNRNKACDQSPEWHAHILAERLKEIEAGQTMSWDEAKFHIYVRAAQIKQDRTRAGLT
jgi:hypothetical protein